MIAVGNAAHVHHHQPRTCVPPVYTPYEQRSDSSRSLPQHAFPNPLTSHRPSTPHTDRMSRLSVSSSTMRPLSRLSFSSTRSAPRRPNIGAPSDFRRVQSGRISPVRKTSTFRPLQLSIYLPGNELPQLPTCWDNFVKEVYNEIEELERPAPVLVKSKSEPMILRRESSSLSIPRKPVASISSYTTFDASHFSMDSNITQQTLSALNDFPKPPKSRSPDAPRTSIQDRRSSIATTKSTQDFLDALDSRLPLPPPAVVRTNSEPTSAIYRRASEQSLRLRTHLEERESLEKRLPDLMEETSPSSGEKKVPLSPISDHSSAFEVDHACEKTLPQNNWFKPTVINVITAGHQPRPLSGSSSFLNTSTLNLDPFHPDAPARGISRAGTPNSLHKRFSQWLLKVLPALPPIEMDTPCEPRPSTALSRWSSSAPTVTAHTKQSSTSTYWTYGAKPSFDISEKTAPPMSPGVGVAF